MNVMRCTIIDRSGGVSFVANAEACMAIVAACAQDPEDIYQLLDTADGFYHSIKDYVLSGLAMFDEMNVEGHYEVIHGLLSSTSPAYQPVFRVVDEVTRETSLTPVKAGAILFNLIDKRIVQLQNVYKEIKRQGRVRIFDGAKATNKVYSYHLADYWSLVP